MNFILRQLQQLGMAALVMTCSLGGTVGILKLIRRLTPGNGIPGDPISKKPEEGRDREG